MMTIHTRLPSAKGMSLTSMGTVWSAVLLRLLPGLAGIAVLLTVVGCEDTESVPPDTGDSFITGAETGTPAFPVGRAETNSADDSANPGQGAGSLEIGSIGEAPAPLAPIPADPQGSGYRVVTHASSFRAPTTAALGIRIYLADIIVHARLLSAGSGELRFRALEYLKGSGNTEFTVVADTEGRNTQWDAQDAILFLSTARGGDSQSRSNQSSFVFPDTVSDEYERVDDPSNPDLPEGFTIDTRNPVWLPAAESGSQSSSLRSSPSDFVTELVSPTDVIMPEVSLNEIRSTIAWQEGGAGIDGYEDCVIASLRYDQFIREWETSSARSILEILEDGRVAEKQIMSGVARHVEISHLPTRRRAAGYDRRFIAPGPNAHLFAGLNVDDDNVPDNGFYVRFVTARPLAQGIYAFTGRGIGHKYRACDYDPIANRVDYEVTVTAPTGTLHEAFFDPVALSGGGVGATGSSGVIDPDEFTVAGDDYEIESLVWNNNSLVLTLDDHVSLSDYRLDFIELDGSIDISLDVSDATVNQTAATWTWSVDSQPWEDGDLLMLRIRETGTEAE